MFSGGLIPIATLHDMLTPRSRTVCVLCLRWGVGNAQDVYQGISKAVLGTATATTSSRRKRSARWRRRHLLCPTFSQPLRRLERMFPTAATGKRPTLMGRTVFATVVDKI